jgi:hypothetical protein
MNEILAIARLLSEAASEGDMDWSKAQVVVEEMAIPLEKASTLKIKPFPSIISTVLEFLGCVDPAGGSGLQFLWRAFTISDCRTGETLNLELLDELSRSLKALPIRRGE